MVSCPLSISHTHLHPPLKKQWTHIHLLHFILLMQMSLTIKQISKIRNKKKKEKKERQTLQRSYIQQMFPKKILVEIEHKLNTSL